MKHLIIVMGTLILGCIIFTMIAGDKNSLRACCGDFIKSNIELYRNQE